MGVGLSGNRQAEGTCITRCNTPRCVAPCCRTSFLLHWCRPGVVGGHDHRRLCDPAHGPDRHGHRRGRQYRSSPHFATARLPPQSPFSPHLSTVRVPASVPLEYPPVPRMSFVSSRRPHVDAISNGARPVPARTLKLRFESPVLTSCY